MEEITTTEETILRGMSESHPHTGYSMMEYLQGATNIEVPKEALVKILLDRELEPDTIATDVEKATRDLCVADLYVWLCYGASRKGSVSDTDNGWTHSDGGYTLSEADKNILLGKANAIYEDNDEDTVGKVKVKIRSHGIRMSDRIPCTINVFRGRVLK